MNAGANASTNAQRQHGKLYVGVVEIIGSEISPGSERVLGLDQGLYGSSHIGSVNPADVIVWAKVFPRIGEGLILLQLSDGRIQGEDIAGGRIGMAGPLSHLGQDLEILRDKRIADRDT